MKSPVKEKLKSSLVKRNLNIGKKVELEHKNTIKKIIDNPNITVEKAAELIAKDHIEEMPDYYDKLEIMESNDWVEKVKDIRHDIKEIILHDGTVIKGDEMVGGGKSGEEFADSVRKMRASVKKIILNDGTEIAGKEVMEDGGSTGNQIGHLEERIQDAFKQPNKWHFINETIDGHTIQMKFFIGAKEVDVQIFKIDGIDMTGKVPGYGKKRETYKAIMDALEPYFTGAEDKMKDGGKTPEIKGLGKFIPIAKIKEITEYFDNHKKPHAGEDPEEAEGYAWLGTMEKYSILGDDTIVNRILAEHEKGKSLMDIHKEIKKMESGGVLKHTAPELLNAGIEIVGENPELIALKNGGKSSMQELFDQSSAILENRFLQGRIDKEEYEKRSKELKAYAKKHNVEYKDGGKPEAKKEEKPVEESKPVNTDAIKQLIELGFINDDYVLTNKGRRIADLHKFCFPIGAHPFSYVKYEVEDLYSKPQYVLVNDTIYYTDGFLVYELGGHLPESLRDSAIQNHTLGNSLAKTISKNLVEYVPYAYCSGISIDEKVNANEGFIVFSSLVNSNNIYVNSFVYNYVIRNYNITGWMADPNGGSLIHAMHNGVTQAIIMINANAIGVNPAFAIFDRDKLMGDLRNKHTQLFIKGESYKEFISGWKSETPSGSGKLVDVENKIKGLEILVELSDDENEIKELNAEIYKLKNSLK